MLPIDRNWLKKISPPLGMTFRKFIKIITLSDSHFAYLAKIIIITITTLVFIYISTSISKFMYV